MKINFVTSSAEDLALAQRSVQEALGAILDRNIDALQCNLSDTGDDREARLAIGALSALAALRAALKSAPKRVEADAKAKSARDGNPAMEGFV